MSQPAYRVRRATVDDLESLRKLWLAMSFPLDGLDKRVTEFQVVETDEGGICGMAGLEVSGRQGRLHGEAFLDFSHADELRGLLWQRLQMVAANRGVARYWTEETAPFWRQAGFDCPNDAALTKFPANWGGEKSRWLTLQAWDEDAVEKSLAKDLAQFKDYERAQQEIVLRRGRMINFIATMLAVILAIFVGIFTVRLLQNHLESLHR
jgi:N-acetylglutamate synthase-like GNAT family acetyltransferase